MRNILFAFVLTIFSFASLSAQMQTLNKDLPCINKTFQIHAHVFLDSLGIANYTPEQLRIDLAGATTAFAPICARFELCGIDTITNYEFDSIGTDIEDTEIKNLFHVKNRINIYLASELQAPPICGYAGGNASVNSSSVVLKCAGGTVIHELGHLFGLPHTFGGNELVDGSNCATEGDGFCDTPADPYIEDPDIVWQDGCEFIWEGKDANGQYYSPAVGNIMSYYKCSCGFSREQFIKMANTYLSSNPKLW
ncbi:MAG: hypothetical protein ACJA1A_000539 [Saprospiraceae bacterium]|jgi:hypothetical protein|tara:strand:+ start:2181 stop:2933 length:753 start_codon:yes stop_codon:yes gene_type:complete